ncbi:apolipoprotein Da, duplicate 1 isoform X2 [Siniperca chuatsi]|uniref:apolipoprotein Da, duplicate 1 isoform X2 n=1 Tax=Siniperca chuatsi TaxID=119488 RepID=UPI001CE221A9|nr:apolipoprotein Da, duplicate 1 isoform X2 [Siniperca chuatsi]
MELSFVLVFAFILPLIRAQVPHWGPCPEPAVQPAFNLKQFMGRWFEIGKLPAQFEKGRCIETNFTLKTDNSIRVVSSEILKGELRKIEGTGVIEDLKNPAKLGISYSYDILRLFHVDFAWILSRTRTLPDSTVERAKEIFANNNIDVSRMIASKQQGCDKTL